MATKFGGKNPWPECNALLGSKVMQGSSRVNERSNCLKMPYGPPNVVGRITDQSEWHCWGQRSWRGQLGSSRGQFAKQCPMATKFGGKNPGPEHNGIAEVRGHTRVSQGQPEVKFLRNVLWPPNIGRNDPRPECNALMGSKILQGSAGVNQR